MKHKFPKRFWIVMLLLGAVAVAHVTALYRITSHLTVPVLVGFVLLMVLTHSGVLGSVYAILVRRSNCK